MTSEPDLTRIYGESELPFEHTSRHTKTGFLVEGPLLSAYIPTPASKRPTHSWIYQHGEAITKKSNSKRLWLCRLCYKKEPKPEVFVTKALPTNLSIRHLVQVHKFNDDGTRSNKRKAEPSDTVAQQLNKAYNQVVDVEDWKSIFLAWAILDDVSLNKTTSKQLRRLLRYRAPLLKHAIPKSRNTTRQWVVQAYEQHQPIIKASLAAAKSRITLSFDGWTSTSQLDVLGVTAHYLDKDFNVKNVLLALRNTYGSHDAGEIKSHLLDVIKEYRISTRLAYFIADSAAANDKALRLLKSDFSIDPSKQRLRCAGHIINLVCKAILYGCDVDCIKQALSDSQSDETSDLRLPAVTSFEAILRGKEDYTTLQAWRKKGPIGKLHNLVFHATRTPARREFFKSKQKEAYGDTKRLYALVVNGGIKWNSTCDMLERAFKLKDAIHLYQEAYEHDSDDPCKDDVLTPEDWSELRNILQLLQPLKSVSLALQSSGKDCNHGSLWESLTGIDYLMTKLERLREQHCFLPDSHFKACVYLGWKKLDKYYELSDTTAAYRAAIAVHPSKKMRWFELKWGQQHPKWIPIAKQAITKLYNEYKQRHVDEAIQPVAPEQSQTEFEQYNDLEDDYDSSDDLERFLREERAPKDTNPLQWWIANHHRYPILRHMAFDLLATPASSSADERTFSQADWSVNSERYNTEAAFVEKNQCMKSWIAERLIYQRSKRQKSDSSSQSG